MFDKDRSGFASISEIKTVIANLGDHFSNDEMTEVMIEVTIFSKMKGLLYIYRVPKSQDPGI